MSETKDVRVSPIPLHECEFRVGDRVRVIDTNSGFSPDDEIFVLGVEWRHQRGRSDFGWNITIASSTDINEGYGATDGWRPEDLIPAPAALEPAPKPAGGGWVTVPREPTESMKERVRGHGGAQALAFAMAAWPDMISAAPPAPAASPSGGEVVVKALEWRRGYCDDQVIIEQASFGGLYQVRQFDGDIWLDHPSASSSKHETVGAAKAAAQADFEQRIRSALTSPEAPQASEVVRSVNAIENLRRQIEAAHPNHKTMFVYVDDLRAALAKIGGDHDK